MTPKRNNNSYNNKSYKDGSDYDIQGVSRWVVTIIMTVVREQLRNVFSFYAKRLSPPGG